MRRIYCGSIKKRPLLFFEIAAVIFLIFPRGYPQKSKAAANFFEVNSGLSIFYPEEHQGSSRLMMMIWQISFVPSFPKKRLWMIWV